MSVTRLPHRVVELPGCHRYHIAGPCGDPGCDTCPADFRPSRHISATPIRTWISSRYTGSFDAAKGLLPEGTNWLKCLDERGHVMFAVYADDGAELGRSIYADNDERCLCAAALRARAKEAA